MIATSRIFSTLRRQTPYDLAGPLHFFFCSAFSSQESLPVSTGSYKQDCAFHGNKITICGLYVWLFSLALHFSMQQSQLCMLFV